MSTTKSQSVAARAFFSPRLPLVFRGQIQLLKLSSAPCRFSFVCWHRVGGEWGALGKIRQLNLFAPENFVHYTHSSTQEHTFTYTQTHTHDTHTHFVRSLQRVVPVVAVLYTVCGMAMHTMSTRANKRALARAYNATPAGSVWLCMGIGGCAEHTGANIHTRVGARSSIDTPVSRSSSGGGPRFDALEPA